MSRSCSARARVSSLAAAVMAAAVLGGGAAPAPAAELPKATRAILEELKLGPVATAGLDKELALPAGWLDKAKAEGALSIVSTWDEGQFAKMVRPFRERYPFIELKYSRSSYNNRVVKTLIAWKEGRHIADIVTGFGGGYFLFRDAGALEDLRNIPAVKSNLIPRASDPRGFWVGQRLRYWCLAYNTKLVPKAQLPKTWDDLVANPYWHDKKIGLGNRPQLWLLMLWGEKGADWTRAYMKKFISTVRPQLRKEGTNALISLAIAGEFKAALPSAAYRVSQYDKKGAPIAWHCPEPVPLAISEMGIVKGSPHLHAARVFVNWFLSKEGQIAQYAADSAPPVHKDLQTKDFLAYPDEILGKAIAFRGPDLENETEKMYAAWKPIWNKAAAALPKAKMVKLKVTLDAVKRRGRTIEFKDGGKARRMSISGRRTKVMIGGAKANRKNLKPGMACVIEAPEGGVEALSVSCGK